MCLNAKLNIELQNYFLKQKWETKNSQRQKCKRNWTCEGLQGHFHQATAEYTVHVLSVVLHDSQHLHKVRVAFKTNSLQGSTSYCADLCRRGFNQAQSQVQDSDELEDYTM